MPSWSIGLLEGEFMSESLHRDGSLLLVYSVVSQLLGYSPATGVLEKLDSSTVVFFFSEFYFSQFWLLPFINRLFCGLASLSGLVPMTSRKGPGGIAIVFYHSLWFCFLFTHPPPPSLPWMAWVLLSFFYLNQLPPEAIIPHFCRVFIEQSITCKERIHHG